MLPYHQITPAERYTLATLRKQVPRLSNAAIARLMGRHPSTISRELRRNGTPYDGRYRWTRDKRRGGTLFRRLRQRPKYRKRYGTNEKRGRLPGKHHISERPTAVHQRRELGHWEMDTDIGSATNDCILPLVEHPTRSVLIATLPARHPAPCHPRPP